MWDEAPREEWLLGPGVPPSNLSFPCFGSSPIQRTRWVFLWIQGSGWYLGRHTTHKMLMRACDEGSLRDRMDVILGPQKNWLQQNDHGPTNRAAPIMVYSIEITTQHLKWQWNHHSQWNCPTFTCVDPCEQIEWINNPWFTMARRIKSQAAKTPKNKNKNKTTNS